MKMKNNISIVAVVLLTIVLTIMALASVSCGDEQKEQEESIGTNSALTSQASEAGGVTVTAAPQNLSENTSSWNFKIAIDSRSGGIGERSFSWMLGQ